MNVGDLNAFRAAITNGTANDAFDMNGDGNITTRMTCEFSARAACRRTWVMRISMASLARRNFVAVFQAGTYEQDKPAGWSEGDWNGDGRFDTAELCGQPPSRLVRARETTQRSSAYCHSI